MVFVVNQSHGKVAFRVNAKSVSYKINEIWSNNAKFDVMIVTSRRHDVNNFSFFVRFISLNFKRYCRGNIYGKIHRKNFQNLSLFKSYKQKVRNMGHYPIVRHDKKLKKNFFKTNDVHISGFVWYCSLITNI